MKLKKELPIIAIVLLPLAYLAYVWKDLPAQVPMHWNIKGEVDRYGDKTELVIMAILLPVIIYAILSIVPKIDPKNKLSQMGGKLHSIKFLLTACMSVLAMFIIYTAKTQSLGHPNLLVLIVGLLVLILGNFFKTIKANYFIGIRTPWTLENETVWKDTHRLGGKLWFAGGILLILSSLVLSQQVNFTFFMVIMAIITLIPVGYSYVRFQHITKASN